MIKNFEDFLNEENKGLWYNIRKKRAEGRRPARKGSKAYKRAVAAAKQIRESVNPAKVEEDLMKQLDSPVGPFLVKVLEWTHDFNDQHAEASWGTIVSPSCKEMVFSCRWEFDSDVHPDFTKSVENEFEGLEKLVPGSEVKVYECNIYSKPCMVVIGIVTPGGNSKFVDEVGEATEEDYLWNLESKYATYEDVLAGTGAVDLHTWDDIEDWVKSGKKLADYRNTSRMKGRRLGL